MSNPRLRVGIDVGGTFTKAVAVNVDTMEIMGISVVPTTHSSEEGVARGVVLAFKKMLEESGIPADAVIFVAHSTTQATNALLEGDVAPVGVVGMGAGSIEAIRAKSLTVAKDIEVAPGRFISVQNSFIDTAKGLSKEQARLAVQGLKDQGVSTIVASEAFGVDNPTRENLIMEAAADLDLPSTGAHEISKLYGLN